MRIESVTAHAFGPLAERTLTLAPGLTVIAGANESGKSSWHAAIHAALCGRRRGRGAATVAERRFAEQHRPWHDEDWRGLGGGGVGEQWGGWGPSRGGACRPSPRRAGAPSGEHTPGSGGTLAPIPCRRDAGTRAAG